MKYTQTQIERAKKRYNEFIQEMKVSNYDVEVIGWLEAQNRVDFHNSIVAKIKAGDKALEREWKLFFLEDEFKIDLKKEQSKKKLAANKQASEPVLAPLRKMKKLGVFYKWLNTSGNPFRKQYFNKKYTSEAVEAFLATL